MQVKKNVDVSVIVPVYNAQKYLNNAFDSLLNQSHKNFEVIFVNDGSKDNSQKVLEEICSKDERFKLINQKNAGVSSARNKGIEMAKGEYVTFLDADDTLEKDALKDLFDNAKKNNSDVVMASVVNKVFEDGSKKISYNDKSTIETSCDLESKDGRKKIWTELMTKYAGTTMWGKLYKKSIIDDANIKVKDYREVLSEDTLFNIEFLNKVKSAYIIDKPVCNYTENLSSLTNEHVDIVNRVDSMNKFIDIAHKYMKNKDELDPILSCFYFTNTLYNISKAENAEDAKKAFDMLDKDYMSKIDLNSLNQSSCLTSDSGTFTAFTKMVVQYASYLEGMKEVNPKFLELKDYLVRKYPESFDQINSRHKNLVESTIENLNDLVKISVEKVKSKDDLHKLIEQMEDKLDNIKNIHENRKKVDVRYNPLDEEYLNVSVLIKKLDRNLQNLTSFEKTLDNGDKYLTLSQKNQIRVIMHPRDDIKNNLQKTGIKSDRFISKEIIETKCNTICRNILETKSEREIG